MVQVDGFDKNKCGYVFNIQYYSLHDGPGIRTIVFFKGCPLRCHWCSNPESQFLRPELAYNDNKCIGIHECGYCLTACTKEAMRKRDNKADVNRTLCENCGKCAEICPSKALNMYGQLMDINEILYQVEKDGNFYARSGGGVTLSGGEPLLQAEFAAELLYEAKKRGIDTAIETCGYADWDKVEKVCAYADTILFDIKCMDTAKHKQYTGVDNKLILENFKKLHKFFPPKAVLVRTPVIPGFNDSTEDIIAIADFIKRHFPGVKYELLAYHRLGEPKYAYIGKKYLLTGVAPIQDEHMAVLNRIIKERMQNK